MGLLLIFESFSEVLHPVIAHGNCLMTTSSLYMVVTENVARLFEVQLVDVKRGLHGLDLLVHQAQIKVDITNLWMIFTCTQLQNA